MDLVQALTILGLDEQATPTDVKARYRALSKEYHPDRQGTNGKMAELNLARDVALAASQETQLVPVDIVRELVQKAMPEGQERQLARERAEEHTNHVIRIGIGRLARYQHLLLVASVGMILLTIWFRIPPGTGLFANESLLYSPIMSTLFAFYAVALALSVWYVRTRAKQIELSVRHLADGLSDTSTYARVIDGLLAHVPPRHEDDEDSVRFTRDDLDQAWDPWIRDARFGPRPVARFFSAPRTLEDVARIAGRTDFLSLLIARGIENGLLGEERMRQDGRLRIFYALQV